MMTTVAPQSPQDQAYYIAKNKHKCEEFISEYNNTNNGLNVEGYCPPIWDEIMCWNSTRAGEAATQPCPWYVAGFYPHRLALKQCQENSTWYAKDHTNPTWTNFSQCHNEQTYVVLKVNNSVNESYLEPYIEKLRTISEVGYSVSLISLVIAFTILISIKKLRCPRNVLHMHLFASFIMRAFMSLLKDTLFWEGLGLENDMVWMNEGKYFNNEHQTIWSCRLIVCLWQYFIMANYSWILMEGLYLHNLIFLALFTDSSSITLYIVLGWGLPLIFVLPWTLCRALLENEFCWTINKNQIVFLLIRGPVTATIVVNFILFVNIARVLLSKLRSSVCEEAKTYRRWAKSTLVLLPLFGVHYSVLLGFQYSMNNTAELIWLFCDRVFTCFNGFFVALLYCFLNGEVRNELSKKWDHFSLQELLKSWHLTGRDSIFTSVRFLGNDRHRRPRGSCYSSASCTIDTYVHSGTRDKKRIIVAHTTVQCKQEADEKTVFNDVKNGNDREFYTTEIKNGLSSMEKDRRWSASDCDIEKNAIELKRITSPDNVVNL